MGILSKNRIYLDYASATPPSVESLRRVMDAGVTFGNPGGIHSEAQAAAYLLATSREAVARVLSCRPREVVFTSGLTESNNLAILGAAEALHREGRSLVETHWVVTSIEHDSVLECFAEIERLGGVVTHVEPKKNGVIAAEDVARALRPSTVLVSVGWGNSEIGTVQPLSDIASEMRAYEKEKGTTILFHTDAGQAPLYRAPIVHTLKVDLFSLGSGKLYGPRGVGALYVGKRAQIAGMIIGGGQERGLRAGTEPVALAAGFAFALQEASKLRDRESKRIKALRDAFAKTMLGALSGSVINGDLRRSLPHMLNISIPNINSEYLVLALDRAGVALSTKAACSEGRRNESHVVRALVGDSPEADWRPRNTLRFSFGRETTNRQLRRALKIVAEVFGSLPKSP